MTDPIDIKSKKKLSEIEADTQARIEQGNESFREAAQEILNQYQELLNEGHLTGIAISGTCKDLVLPPQYAVRYTDELYKIKFAISELDLEIQDYLCRVQLGAEDE